MYDYIGCFKPHLLLLSNVSACNFGSHTNQHRIEISMASMLQPLNAPLKANDFT